MKEEKSNEALAIDNGEEDEDDDDEEENDSNDNEGKTNIISLFHLKLRDNS